MIDEYSDQNINTDDFTSLPSFQKRVALCRQKLGKPIGNGSSRMVFAIDDTKVLKLAKNRKGIAQNELECRNSEDYYAKDMFARVYEYDSENYMYIVSERARKATESEVQKVLGMPYSEFIRLCNGFVAQYTTNPNFRAAYSLKDEEFEIIEENDNIRQWYDYICNYQPFSVGEITSLRNMGIVDREYGPELIIVDSGFDEDVFNQYYKRIREAVRRTISEMLHR